MTTANEKGKRVLLRSVRTRASKLSENQAALHASMYRAHNEGASYRELGEAAGISHTQAKRIVDAERDARAETS